MGRTRHRVQNVEAPETPGEAVVSVRGSISKDAVSGRWMFVVDLPVPGGGRRQAKRRGFATRRAAQEALDQLMAEARIGGYTAPRRLTLARFLLEEWLPAKRTTLKPTTFASYRDVIRAQVVPNLGEVRLADIDGATLNGFYGRILTEGRRDGRGGLSAKTVRNIDGVLSKAFRDAVRWGKLVRNPCDAADPPRKPTPELAVWTEAEIAAFLGVALADRLQAVWMLVATTGMRRGELCGLRWTDVDLDARRMTISQTRTLADHEQVVGEPKTAAGARTIALHPEAVAALRAWRKVQREERLLVGGGWQETGLVVTEPTGAGIHPQRLTRRFTSMVARALSVRVT